MNDEPDDLARSLRVLARESLQRQGPDAHPSPGTLTAYHAGELTPDDEDELQEHLAVCRHCARLLLDLPAFLEAPAAGPESPDAEAEASWREIRRRLPGPPANAVPRRGAQPSWRSASQPTPLRLAAAVLLALAAVPLWMIARHLASPEFAPATIELSPAEGQRGTTEAPAPAPATVHAEAASTTLLLRLAREQPALRFRVELRAADAAGAPTGSSVAVPLPKVVDSRTLLLVLARRQLAPGRYQLRVVDAEQPSAEPLAEYPLKVVEP